MSGLSLRVLPLREIVPRSVLGTKPDLFEPGSSFRNRFPFAARPEWATLGRLANRKTDFYTIVHYGNCPDGTG